MFGHVAQVEMFQFLNLVLDLLDHRINLLAEVHHLQDIFHQRNRVQHNVEQEGIGPAPGETRPPHPLREAEPPDAYVAAAATSSGLPSNPKLSCS